jgi:hypothetical protein
VNFEINGVLRIVEQQKGNTTLCYQGTTPFVARQIRLNRVLDFLDSMTLEFFATPDLWVGNSD